jgi:hypothetical protein
MPDATECCKCGDTGTDSEILVCPICYKGVCFRCSIKISGRDFCSQACANYFFHGDDDEAGGSDE